MCQDIVGHRHQRVFFSEHRPVFAHKRQPVDVGIDDDAQIGFFGRNACRNFGQVFRDRFGIVGEITVGRAVQLDYFDAHLAQQFRNHYAANGVYRIDYHLEFGFAYRIEVSQLECQRTADVFVVVAAAFDDATDPVDFRIGRYACLGQCQYFFPFRIVEEFAVRIEQFERIPLFRVVAGGKKNAAVGLLAGNGQFDRGGGGQSDIDDIHPAAAERTFDDRGGHFAREARIAADYDLQPASRMLSFEPFGISRCEFYEIQRGEVVAGRSADGSANTGNGFNQCHTV